MVIAAQFLPQLLTYEDETAKQIIRNLKKVEIKNEYQLVDLGIKEYVSIPKLDQKAFRYIQKNGQLYLRESVYSVGGLVQDSVLINLGEFTLGDDEVGADLAYLARVKDAKAKQRQKQLREGERIAQTALAQVQRRVKKVEVLQAWQHELQEAKLFVRLGKEDYYQSQMAILAKFASQDEELAKIMVDYQAKLNAKNEKWLTAPLKLPKPKNEITRVGVAERESIGEINPKRRAAFQEYYKERNLQMHEYLHGREEVTGELPPPPTELYRKPEPSVTAAPEISAQPKLITAVLTTQTLPTEITSTATTEENNEQGRER